MMVAEILAWARDAADQLGLAAASQRLQAWAGDAASLAQGLVASSTSLGETVGEAVGDAAAWNEMMRSALERSADVADAAIAWGWFAVVVFSFLKLPRRLFLVAAGFLCSGAPGLVALLRLVAALVARAVAEPAGTVAALAVWSLASSKVFQMLGRAAGLDANADGAVDGWDLLHFLAARLGLVVVAPAAVSEEPDHSDSADVARRLAKLERKIELLLHASSARSPAVVHGAGRGPRSPSQPPTPTSDASPRAGLRAAASKLVGAGSPRRG